jgi:hypothetical protein
MSSILIIYDGKPSEGMKLNFETSPHEVVVSGDELEGSDGQHIIESRWDVFFDRRFGEYKSVIDTYQPDEIYYVSERVEFATHYDLALSVHSNDWTKSYFYLRGEGMKLINPCSHLVQDPEVLKYILEGCDHLIAYKASGFEEGLLSQKLGSYHIQVSSPWISFLIDYYSIGTHSEDTTHQRCMIESSAFRGLITYLTEMSLAKISTTSALLSPEETFSPEKLKDAIMKMSLAV